MFIIIVFDQSRDVTRRLGISVILHVVIGVLWTLWFIEIPLNRLAAV